MESSSRRVVAVVSIFSLVNMSFGISPVFGENAQSTPRTIQTISPLSEKEIFALPQTAPLGLGQIFPQRDVRQSSWVQEDIKKEKEDQDKKMIDTHEGAQECREIPQRQIIPCVVKEHVIKKELTVIATAYSSTAAQTDSSPCTTANGYNVCRANRENVVAANFLPFGTKVKFPEVYGDKIFTVQDRMHPRFSKRVDFWMKTTGKARQFGVKRVKVQVVEELLAQNF